jgi:hypothetical protein
MARLMRPRIFSSAWAMAALSTSVRSVRGTPGTAANRQTSGQNGGRRHRTVEARDDGFVELGLNIGPLLLVPVHLDELELLEGHPRRLGRHALCDHAWRGLDRPVLRCRRLLSRLLLLLLL